MGAMPDFEVGSLGSVLIGLRSFYRRLGFQVELAYIRMGGKCACGDEYCTLNPHFASDDVDRSRGIHLVMNAEKALATRDTRILHGVFGRLAKVPILKHEGTVYIFVLDPESVPDLFPVLGPGVGLWISLPPQRSDDIVGVFGLPAWLTPLDMATDQLPDAGSVFHPVVVERWEHLRALSEDLRQRLCGDGVFDLRELLCVAAENVVAESKREVLLDLVGKACIGDVITLDQAYEILTLHQHIGNENTDLVESLHRILYGILFVQDDLDTGIVEQQLTNAALSLTDLVDGDELVDIDDVVNIGGTIEPLPDVETDTLAVDLRPEKVPKPLLTEEAVEYRDERFAEKIDWASLLSEWTGDFSALALAMHLLSITELSLGEDNLTKLALVDMLATAFPDGGDNLTAMFCCLWPTMEEFATELNFHTLVVQLFAGMLLRFKMIGDAGMLPEVPSLLEQLISGRGDHIFSDLVRSPELLFWIERHILRVNTPSLLAQRVEFVANVIELVRHGIVTDISTDYFLDLIGNDIDD